MIAWLLPVLKMAGRNGYGCAASSKMEKNTDLVRLEGRIDAASSESRERLLRMQVLRGVLDRERMLMRISAQEKELDSLKSAQRLLQVSRAGSTEPVIPSAIIVPAVTTPTVCSACLSVRVC